MVYIHENGSYDSIATTGTRLWSDSRQWARDLFFFEMSRLTLGHIQPFIQWITGSFSTNKVPEV
jgi:hypothetical protein